MNNPKNSLPNGWSLKKLGEIAKITSGGTPDRGKPSYWNGEYPWISTSLIDFNVIEKAEEYITEEGLSNSSAKLFPIGTILMAMYGQGKTRGKVALLGMEAATNQACAAIILNSRQTVTDFVFQNLASRYDEIRGLSNVGNQENLNGELIKGLPVKLPPLPEQQKIATILGTWDAAIQTTTALLAALQKRKKGLMQQLLRPKSDWKEVRLGEGFERLTRRNTEGNTNVLTISAQHGLISQRDFFNKLVASEDVRGYFLLKKGEFAYNKSYSTGYPWGAYKRLDDYEKGILSPLYICFSLKNGDSDFFVHFFEAGRLDKGIYTIAQEGARNHGLLNMSVGDFFNLRFTIPPLAEQTRIAAILNTADAELRQTEAYLEKLKTQKRGLMQQLLTGKVRVTTR